MNYIVFELVLSEEFAQAAAKDPKQSADYALLKEIVEEHGGEMESVAKKIIDDYHAGKFKDLSREQMAQLIDEHYDVYAVTCPADRAVSFEESVSDTADLGFVKSIRLIGPVAY